MNRPRSKKPLNSFETDVAPDDAWEYLQNRINVTRRDKMLAVAAKRSFYIRLGLQDIHDPHNVGACLRSAEALGIQNCDFINLYQKFTKPSKVSRGAFQWLDLCRFNDQALYLQGIKERGYRIAAAYPSATDCKLEDIPLDRPLLVLFGNEHAGLHESWAPHVDYRFAIPMVGMVESFNISVSVALSLYSLSLRCRQQAIPRYFASEAEQRILLNRWISRQSRALNTELECQRRAKARSPG